MTLMSMQEHFGAARLIALSIVAFLVCPIGLSAQDQTPAHFDPTRVQTEIATMISAVYGEDIDTILRYTHPKVIELLGGEVSARQKMGPLINRLANSGVILKSLDFPSPPQFYRGGGSEFVIVPTFSVYSSSKGAIESLNFQIGMYEAESSSWKYVEGSRVNKDNIHIFFPGFPTDVVLPEFYRKRR